MKTDIEDLVTKHTGSPKPKKYGTFFDYKIEELEKEDLLEIIRWTMFENDRVTKDYFSSQEKMFDFIVEM